MGNLSTPVAARSKSKRSKERIKSSTAAIYASVFALLISVVAVGYRAPQEVPSVAASSVASTLSTVQVAGSVPSASDVVAAGIAADVAQAADLFVSGHVAELAVSTQVRSMYSGADEVGAVVKPTIIELSSASRSIVTYAVEDGDTLESIAKKFNISVDTIKWANDISGSTVAAGKVLDILPRSGITYVVKGDDTIESIAKKYKASESAITTFNDLEISGLKRGLKIIVPGGVLPEAERPGYVSPVSTYTTSFVTGYSSGFSGKSWFIRYGTPNMGRYAAGNCTAFAFDYRSQIGRPIGAMWGHAGAWATNAIAAGYTVNRTPAAGAVIQDAGHVAIVKDILPNGDLELIEMNNSRFGPTWPGNNVVSGRILPKSHIGQYLYIH